MVGGKTHSQNDEKRAEPRRERTQAQEAEYTRSGPDQKSNQRSTLDRKVVNFEE